MDRFSVTHHKSIGSTNDEARRLAAEGAPHGTAIHADEQTAGRGRLSHAWFSPPGNLYLSVLLRTGQPASRCAELSFLTALAVADATIIGIGLNVLQAPSNTAYKATTIVANGGIASVDGARDILLDRLGRHLEVWSRDGFPPIREQWLRRTYPIGAAVRANVGGQSVAGDFAGLDLDGALLLDMPAGRRRIVAGEVTAG
jgi:BirA family transcriptional regulator, biotin operon repressor / biotin---[acetyl-CoA-carboxylase] ligase